MGVRCPDHPTQSGNEVEALGWVGVSLPEETVHLGGGGGRRLQPYGALSPVFSLQFEAFCAGGLAPGWSLTVQGHADAGEDK